MKKKLLILFVYLTSTNFFAQNVGINATGAAPNTSAMLDIANTTKGLLIPRVSLVATNNNAPIGAGIATSLLVYNIATAGVAPNNVLPGYYYWDGTEWIAIAGDGSKNWGLLGNAGTVDGTNFIGTTDNVPLNFRVNNQKAGRIDNINGNVFFGYQSGNSITTGSANTVIGNQAFFSNTTSTANIAIGYQALYNSFHSFAVVNNLAIGYKALYANTTGNGNFAIGRESLVSNTIGSGNTACGDRSMAANIQGSSNTAFGSYVMNSNVNGNNNTAFGFSSLFNCINGLRNTAVGWSTLSKIKNETDNTAIGMDAGGGSYGSMNTYVGSDADAVFNTTVTNACAIGYSTTVNSSNTMIFGNSSVIGWGFGVQPSAGVDAFKIGSNATNGNGARLTLAGVWTNASDSTKKYNIKNCKYGLNEILKLRPVSYNMKVTKKSDIGFIAQEVRLILPELVYGVEGDMTLSYSQITAVLTNAMQEQQKIIDYQKEKIKSLEERLNKLEAKLK